MLAHHSYSMILNFEPKRYDCIVSVPCKIWIEPSSMFRAIKAMVCLLSYGMTWDTDDWQSINVNEQWTSIYLLKVHQAE